MRKKLIQIGLVLLYISIPITIAMVLSDRDEVPDLPSSRQMIILTSEARDIVLYDFDYLVHVIMETAPTQNIFYRRFDISMEDFFAAWRQVIYDKTPMPSLTEAAIGRRWANVPEDDLYLAADYLFSVLMQINAEIEDMGHMGPLGMMMARFSYALTLYAMRYERYLDPAAIDLWTAEYDLTPEEVEFYLRVAESVVALGNRHYEIFHTPSALWFYGPELTAFNSDISMDSIGFMNPNNVTTRIIEPGRIAYLRIASFMNNIELDSVVLFPFYEQVQNYEHLIIDLRGNSGGLPASFATNIVSMLIDESISFMHPEFFIASELTFVNFENPMSHTAMKYNTWDAIVPITEFMQNQNMPYFNQDDLAFLDYVIVWYSEFSPAENNIPFAGKIWILVDDRSASASELAAKISMGTGFATVVGEPTQKVTPTIAFTPVLPNTGILFRVDLGYTVNPCGRSLEEYGVIPQIPNALGMDALETVLSIINKTPE